MQRKQLLLTQSTYIRDGGQLTYTLGICQGAAKPPQATRIKDRTCRYIPVDSHLLLGHLTDKCKAWSQASHILLSLPHCHSPVCAENALLYSLVPAQDKFLKRGQVYLHLVCGRRERERENMHVPKPIIQVQRPEVSVFLNRSPPFLFVYVSR